MKNIVYFIVFFFPLISLSQTYYDFLPSSNSQVVHHNYFSLSYSEEHEQAAWVFYEINKNRELRVVSRKNNFRKDKKIKTGSADLNDYKGSIYDRGHLAPARDFSFNQIAMSESFYMSNISPQNRSFNRGIWKKLEALVSQWGEISNIFVATGPVLDSCIQFIGNNNVCVPEFYYKIIYDPLNQKMISFMIPNQKGTKHLRDYVCSTDYIESRVKIDFFPILEDDLEEYLESNIEKENWLW